MVFYDAERYYKGVNTNIQSSNGTKLFTIDDQLPSNSYTWSVRDLKIELSFNPATSGDQPSTIFWCLYVKRRNRNGMDLYNQISQSGVVSYFNTNTQNKDVVLNGVVPIVHPPQKTADGVQGSAIPGKDQAITSFKYTLHNGDELQLALANTEDLTAEVEAIISYTRSSKS